MPISEKLAEVRSSAFVIVNFKHFLLIFKCVCYSFYYLLFVLVWRVPVFCVFVCVCVLVFNFKKKQLTYDDVIIISLNLTKLKKYSIETLNLRVSLRTFFKGHFNCFECVFIERSAEAYLETCQAYMMDFFCGNSQRFQPLTVSCIMLWNGQTYF